MREVIGQAEDLSEEKLEFQKSQNSSVCCHLRCPKHMRRKGTDVVLHCTFGKGFVPK